MATVLTNTGEQYLCDFLSGVTALDAQYVGWGTGAGTAVKANTSLNTEASEARVVGALTTQGTLASAVFQVIGTITADGTKTIQNAGLFDAVSSGKLIIHGDFGGIALVLNDKIEFTFTLDPS